MIPVFRAASAREADRQLVEEVGVPGIALMETASRALAQVVAERFAREADDGVVVACGPGNNGGDGYGCARWLHTWGFPVAVLHTSSASSGDAAVMRAACRARGVPEVERLDGAGVVVDALFGTGLSRDLEGRFADLVRDMGLGDAPVVAADLPTGLDADTGAVWGECPTASVTVTFGGAKPGMYAGEGPRRCGEVVVVDIGVDAAGRDAEVPEASDLSPLWPERDPLGHKTRSGHLLVVAGSAGMAGAAVLTCRGAFAAGAGLVTLVAPRGAWPRLTALPPEVMVLPGGDGDLWDGRLPELDRFDALACGPGLGAGEALGSDPARALAGLYAGWGRPMAVDADALEVARGYPGGPRVLTPHPGEAARMLDLGIGDVQGDRFRAAEHLAADGAVVLLKGPRTLVAAAGMPCSVNPTGGPMLSTAGSGDVLTGVIGALLARGVEARDAARLAAWVHGWAGESLVPRGEGVTASDIVDVVPEAARALAEGTGFP